MAVAALEMAGVALSVLGWMGVILVCALPMWRVTAFIGSNIIVAQVFWEGLWMNCVNQSTGQMQCKVYDSLLALSQDLQAARAMVTISIALGFLAILLSIIGAKCTNCVQDESIKARISIATGIMFIITGLLTLIPVCWTANTVIRDFYNPLLTDAQRRELGACLYIGWACSAGLIAGGALLCCTCPPKEDNHYSTKYSVAKSTAPSKIYV